MITSLYKFKSSNIKKSEINEIRTFDKLFPFYEEDLLRLDTACVQVLHHRVPYSLLHHQICVADMSVGDFHRPKMNVFIKLILRISFEILCICLYFILSGHFNQYLD